MRRWIVPALLLVAVLAIPAFAGPASAANVPVTLIAKDVNWHVGSDTAPTKPTITVAPGDVLQLTVENHDGFNHTFTVPHFGVNESLSAGATVRVNITTSNADNGTWQFYCSIPGHTTGTYPNLDGMVGWIKVASATPPPPTPGFDTVLVVLALAGVAGVVRVVSRRKQR